MSSAVDAILAKGSIVRLAEQYTELRPVGNGTELRGVCPITSHENATNNTSFVITDNKWFYCNGCGCHGNLIQLYSEIEGMPFFQSIEALAEILSINLDDNQQYQQQKSIVKANTIDMMKYHKNVDKVKQHLITKRGLSEETISEFKIGYDEKGDFLASHSKPETFFPGIVFSIFDSYGRCAGFSKRRTDGITTMKYRNSYEDKEGVFKKGDILYGYHKIRKTIHKTKSIDLVEGFYDQLSCYEQEVNALAYLSGGLTKSHFGLLNEINKMHSGLTFNAFMDNDSTGIKETMKLREKQEKYKTNLNFRVRCYPKDKFVFPDGEERLIKDANDFHILGINIADIPTKHIDLWCLEVILDRCGGVIESEYREVDLYMPSVKNTMIRADIARMLAKRWDQKIEDVTDYLKLSKVSVSDNILKEFKSAMDGVKECEDMVLNHDGITIGYPSIDKSLDGLRKSDCLFLSARPSVGKTFIAMEIALHHAIRLKLNVLFISLEMSAGSLYERIIANIYKMEVRELRQRIKDGSFDYTEVFNKIQKHLKIVDTPGLTMEEIEERIMIANTKDLFDGKVDVVIIDYVQLISGMSDFQEFEAKVTAFKPMARKYNIILIPLSQMNRTAKSWLEPDISQMKGGGALEATGDIILLLWKTGENPELSEIERKDLENVISCKIGKCRRDAGQKFFELEAYKEQTTIRERSEVDELKRLKQAN